MGTWRVVLATPTGVGGVWVGILGVGAGGVSVIVRSATTAAVIVTVITVIIVVVTVIVDGRNRVESVIVIVCRVVV